MMEKDLTVKEAAERLQTTESTVYAAVRAKRLPAYRLGNKKGIRITQKGLQEYKETLQIR